MDAVYGAALPGEAAEVPAAAVVLRAGATLDVDALSRALGAVGAEARPRFVRLLDALPMTEGYRPLKAALRAQGLPSTGRALVHDVARGAYVERAADGLQG